MKNSIKLLVGLLATSGNLFSMVMMSPDYLYITNDLNRRLKVSWTTHSNKNFSATVDIEGSSKIDEFTNIAPGSSVKIEPYGSVFGWSAFSLEIKRSVLVAEFNELNPGAKDSLDIRISQGYSTSLTPTYKVYVPVAEVKLFTNPMKEFKGLNHYPNLMHLKEQDIVGYSSWETVVIKGSLTTRPTLALDVYRYMLGIPVDYSEDYVKKIYKDFARTWHPDRGAHGTNKEYAQQVFNLAHIAYKGLLDARDSLYGVTIIKEEEEPITEQAIVPVNEESV